MTPADASVLVRVVPPEFRGPAFTVSRNNVYEWVQGNSGAPVRRLVGQLEQGHQVRLPAEQATRLFGGQAAMGVLNAVGSVASIANLGVCVVGFLHVSRALKRVEARIERVEQKLDVLTELVGVIDQKVDQLLWIGEVQMEALAEIRGLMLSFQTAAVHRALETLDLRSRTTASLHHDAELMGAARTLHDYRIWLAQLRESDPTRPPPVRAELLRAEVMVALAEARARCIANDAPFAALELERVLGGAREEVVRMRRGITSGGGVPSLLSCIVEGVDDMHAECVGAWSWIDGRSTRRSTSDLLRETTRGYNDLAQRLATLEGATSAGGPVASELSRFHQQGLLRTSRVSDADAASFVAAHRLARSLEPALTVCTAMEIVGEPVRSLLTAQEAPGSPALVIELDRQTTATP